VRESSALVAARPASGYTEIEEQRIALRVRGISKTFPGVQALRGVDLDVAAGSVHALLGHNGCGKSTLIKALAGVHAPDPGGEAWLAGEPFRLGHPEEAERGGLRFVHQELGLIEELSAVDNVGFILGFEHNRIGRISWRRQTRVTRELLERFGFALDPREPLSKATPAERTAVAIVRAVAGWQKGDGVLILDEPTAALPSREVDELFRLIREIRDSGTAVILVSHRLDEVMSIADHATVMRDGQVVWDGPVASMTGNAFVRLIADAGEDEQDVGAFRRVRDDEPTDAGAPVVLRAANLTSTYLRDVSVEVRAGEIVGVAGLLGSGREELPYILAGARTEGVSGTFDVGGRTHDELTTERAMDMGVVLVPADRAREGIIGDFTTGQNVSLVALPRIARRRAVWPGRETGFAEKWLRAVNADPGTVSRPIATLSGGNQQKAVLARWLSIEPTVLVMSEPTAGVDVGARSVIYDELRARARSGLGVLISSSDVDDLLAICDRVIVLRDGIVVAEFAGASVKKPSIIAAVEGVEHE
jgi:ribose transport system ATP-binding protein